MSALLVYLAAIVSVNAAFIVVPFVHLPYGEWSVGTILVGGVFVARDYAARAQPRLVYPAMALGVLITASMSGRLALASGVAFATSEGLEALLFHVTRRPFRERVLASALPACVIDTALFLGLAGFFSWPMFWTEVVVKVASVSLLAWRARLLSKLATAAPEAA